MQIQLLRRKLHWAFKRMMMMDNDGDGDGICKSTVGQKTRYGTRYDNKTFKFRIESFREQAGL